jgi:hypothetical protein
MLRRLSAWLRSWQFGVEPSGSATVSGTAGKSWIGVESAEACIPARGESGGYFLYTADGSASCAPGSPIRGRSEAPAVAVLPTGTATCSAQRDADGRRRLGLLCGIELRLSSRSRPHRLANHLSHRSRVET